MLTLMNSYHKLSGILDAIESFVLNKQSMIDFRDSIGGQYPKIRKELNHKIEIYENCIERLWTRYYKSKGDNGPSII